MKWHRSLLAPILAAVALDIGQAQAPPVPDPADLAEGMRLYQQKGTAERAMGGPQTE